MKYSLKINAFFMAVLISMYYYLGWRSFSAFVVSVLVHELGHIIGVWLSGGRVKSIYLEAGGFLMGGAGMTHRFGEFASILSGPMFGFALAVGCYNLSLNYGNAFLYAVSKISFYLSVYNMLPALPLDGGRLMECVLSVRVGSINKEKILDVTGVISGVAIILLGGHLSQLMLVGGGAWLLIAQTGIVKSRRVL